MGLLTYDTTLQVIAWTAQKDLFLDGSLLGRHLLAFLLAGVETEGERARGKRRGRKSRTSCGREEKGEGGGALEGENRAAGAHCGRALQIGQFRARRERAAANGCLMGFFTLYPGCFLADGLAGCTSRFSSFCGALTAHVTAKP